MTIREGLKKHGDKARDAMGTELKQLHDHEVFHPINADSLTDQQKEDAMKLLMFLKEKKDESLKGRGCADGRKQQGKYEKEDVTSPTVALESVLLTSIIDAHENRDVAVVDIPGAFLQADQDKDVWVLFDGTLAELMVKMSPEIYSK